MSDIPILAKEFSEKWFSAGNDELSAMLDIVRLNSATGETQKGVFLSALWYQSYPEMLLAAKKAMNIAVSMGHHVTDIITRDVPHFSAVPPYLLDEHPDLGIMIWINAYVVIEGGEAEYNRVLIEAKKEAEAWEAANKGDYGILRSIQVKNRMQDRMPSYRTAELRLNDAQRNVLRLLNKSEV